MDIQPLGNRITLRVPPAPDKIGSLWLPEQAKETFTICQGEIVAVGPLVRDGRLRPGVHVIVKRFGGFPHDEAKTLWTVYESHVLAILNEEAL